MPLQIDASHSVTAVRWDAVSTVLLDMDGTLLDLRFDNEFWGSTVQRRYAELNNLDLASATAQLAPVFAREAGKLNWYCLDFWSRTLGFDVIALKREHSHGIAWRPEAEDFLRLLQASRQQVLLITNAHPETLRIKMQRVNLEPWFDRVLSSHDFAVPKEHPEFWQQLMALHPFDPDTTLFIDDSDAVLGAAEAFGVRHLITLRQPDSEQPPRARTRYPAIHHFSEIQAGLPCHG